MIKILHPGFFNTIQDKGRVGFAEFGVPISGAMDSFSADLANHILNNSLENALLEITFGGCSLQFLENTIICISGADFLAMLNDTKVSLNTQVEIRKNDVLTFGKRIFGSYAYLAVTGGFQSEIKLKSRSFFQNITNEHLLKKGDLLPISSINKEYSISNASIKFSKHHFESKEIYCYKGPEFEILTDFQQKALFEKSFTISKEINRIGYKLNEFIENNLPQILTSAVLPGTVQLAPSGKLIVLMRDCQVTGGYPRILQLSENSINQFAQKTTNDTFRFSLLEN
ncbi:biotin-dependent carboxyltransferase family protein [Polaribacter sp. BAL334]|uniref:5-oxoprolinase subunit C family protein n=1 Tax=Polaribacter sp. BAL334 TaxID=1708178 RepID=UPI0018D22ACB|nr:biotin-dependent carboxyltransferase family protein [Polaribacter sp. BAL334]MBG7612692.1 biotin-dependent carboxyltransferase family protein [Polaribacter sp. BAL334]